MQLEEVAEELRRQITLRQWELQVPSCEDVTRLIEEGYVHSKPQYYHADIGDFVQAWQKYLEEHSKLVEHHLSLPKRVVQWLQVKLRRT